MSVIKKTNQIVDRMKGSWINATGGTYYFGQPQDVDNIHSKTLPLMVMNPPQCTMKAENFNKHTFAVDSNWTFVVYNNLPSRYNVTDDLAILEFWDTMEDSVLYWFIDWFNLFEADGVEFIMTSPVQITRLKEASNDRLLALKVTFGFNFYRYCEATS